SAGHRRRMFDITDSASLAVRTSYPRPVKMLTTGFTPRGSSSTTSTRELMVLSFVDSDAMSLAEYVNRFNDLVAAGFRVAHGRGVPGQFLELRRVELAPAAAYPGGRRQRQLQA